MKHKFLFSVFIIFFIFVFIALGTWQIIRLNWKNNLILEIENSLKNPPVELSQSNKENFLKIKTSGIIDFEKQNGNQKQHGSLFVNLIITHSIFQQEAPHFA